MILGKKNGAVCVLLAPVMKSGRVDVGAYRAVHEDNPCVIPPGTADIGRVLRTTLRGKAAVVENIAVFCPSGVEAAVAYPGPKDAIVQPSK